MMMRIFPPHSTELTADGEVYTRAEEPETVREMPVSEMTVVTDVTRVVETVMPSVVSIWGTYTVSDTFW